MLRVGVLVSGGGTNLQAIIDEVNKGNLKINIVTVVSSNPKSFALQRAEKNNIEAVYMSKKEYGSKYEEALASHFKERNVGLVVMAGFMVILKETFIKEYKNKILNIHPSLIPAFCGEGMYGLKVHEAVLAKGVKVTGATVHFVDEGTDTGPIVLQKAVEVHDNDTPETLQERVMREAEQKIYPEAIRLISEGKLALENNIVRRVDDR